MRTLQTPIGGPRTPICAVISDPKAYLSKWTSVLLVPRAILAWQPVRAILKERQSDPPCVRPAAILPVKGTAVLRNTPSALAFMAVVDADAISVSLGPLFSARYGVSFPHFTRLNCYCYLNLK